MTTMKCHCGRAAVDLGNMADTCRECITAWLAAGEPEECPCAGEKKMNRTHKYRGQTIKPCEFAIGEHRGRWAVRTRHITGVPFADDFCAHYQTLAEAKAAIDEWTRTDHVS